MSSIGDDRSLQSRSAWAAAAGHSVLPSDGRAWGLGPGISALQTRIVTFAVLQRSRSCIGATRRICCIPMLEAPKSRLCCWKASLSGLLRSGGTRGAPFLFSSLSPFNINHCLPRSGETRGAGRLPVHTPDNNSDPGALVCGANMLLPMALVRALWMLVACLSAHVWAPSANSGNAGKISGWPRDTDALRKAMAEGPARRRKRTTERASLAPPWADEQVPCARFARTTCFMSATAMANAARPHATSRGSSGA